MLKKMPVQHGNNTAVMRPPIALSYDAARSTTMHLYTQHMPHAVPNIASGYNN